MMDFTKFLITEREHWQIYLHKNQYYLGRCYLWAKREDDVSLAGTSKDEWLELKNISLTLEGVLRDLFNPHNFEYHQMGNETPHLHVHIVPRYSSPRNFGGIRFIDEKWPETPYPPYNRDFQISEEIIERIRISIERRLD